MTKPHKVQQCFLKHGFERYIETQTTIDRASDEMIMNHRSWRKLADDELFTFKIWPIELLLSCETMVLRQRNVNPFTPKFHDFATRRAFDINYKSNI